MNTSYKIVLLGAFVLFTAVIGYYALSDRSEAEAADDNNPLAARTPGADGADTPATRDTPTPRGTRPTLPLDPPNEPGVVIDTPGGDTLDFRVDESPLVEDPPPGPGTDALALEESTTPRPLGLERSGPTPPAEGTDPAPPAGDAGDPLRRGPLTDIDDDSGVPPTDTELLPEEDDTPERPLPRYPDDPDTPGEADTPATDTPGRITRTYTVKAGDTLSSIALGVYGEEKAWFDIAQANPSIDPKRLQVGQVIALPDLSGGGASDDPAPPAPGTDQTYTVRPGDNLSRIAQRFYGDSEAWDLIYNRNRDKIGPRPDNIKVGMVLIIPQAYRGAE